MKVRGGEKRRKRQGQCAFYCKLQYAWVYRFTKSGISMRRRERERYLKNRSRRRACVGLKLQPRPYALRAEWLLYFL